MFSSLSEKSILILTHHVTTSFFKLLSQHGQSFDVVSNGQVIDSSRSKVKIIGDRGYVRVRIPDSFYWDITTVTDAQALGVLGMGDRNSTFISILILHSPFAYSE